MIEVLGLVGSAEHAAAVAIRDAMVRLWPGIEDTPPEDDRVLIAANAKLSGYKISDIDVIVGASFGRKRYFVPTRALKDGDGRSVSGTKIRVASMLVAVEVKGQDEGGIRVASEEVNVRYSDGWKSATAQNIDQVHALGKYFSDQHIDAWVYRCLILNGLSKLPTDAGQPRPAAGAVALGFSGASFLTAIAGVNKLQKWGAEFVVSSAKPDKMAKALGASVFKKIVPSRLDRIRMDRISSRPAEAREIAALLGKQRVHIRGHGGTGKTILMLQAAHEAYELYGRRCLILTYNRALAADIQRSLALMGVPARLEGGGVEVRTAMSFIYSWLNRLELASDDGEGNDSFDLYSGQCAEALEAFNAGALGEADVARVIAADAEAFDFDALIVDEAQDWPQLEAELLARIYGGNKIAIADGRDQLVRGSPTNWKKTLPAGAASDDRSLVQCLRMKRNLGIFVNAVAQQADINWSVEPNEQAAGGRVILLSGEYSSNLSLPAILIDEAQQAKNEKVDFLHCVPAGNVTSAEGRRHSKLALALSNAGHEVWDGVDAIVRKDFPRSVDAFRVVQYDSCRGLEGWTTVLEGFDEFWNARYDTAFASAKDDEGYRGRSYEEAARSRAWRWAMIPLTRPIDTIVIAFRDRESSAAKVLLTVAARYPDFVTCL
jgi:hypothetical protein